jgi:hypothetical protein
MLREVAPARLTATGAVQVVVKRRRRRSAKISCYFPGDYSKGEQRYPRALPCLRPRPRLSAARSKAPAAAKGAQPRQFGDPLSPVFFE